MGAHEEGNGRPPIAAPGEQALPSIDQIDAAASRLTELARHEPHVVSASCRMEGQLFACEFLIWPPEGDPYYTRVRFDALGRDLEARIRACVEDATARATEAFGELLGTVLAEHFPEARSGDIGFDLDPVLRSGLVAPITANVAAWVEANVGEVG
jgi:hypothetical protein